METHRGLFIYRSDRERRMFGYLPVGDMTLSGIKSSAMAIASTAVDYLQHTMATHGMEGRKRGNAW